MFHSFWKIYIRESTDNRTHKCGKREPILNCDIVFILRFSLACFLYINSHSYASDKCAQFHIYTTTKNNTYKYISVLKVHYINPMVTYHIYRLQKWAMEKLASFPFNEYNNNNKIDGNYTSKMTLTHFHTTFQWWLWWWCDCVDVSVALVLVTVCCYSLTVVPFIYTFIYIQQWHIFA